VLTALLFIFVTVTIGYTTHKNNGWDLTPLILCNSTPKPHLGVSHIYLYVCTYCNFSLATLK